MEREYNGSREQTGWGKGRRRRRSSPGGHHDSGGMEIPRGKQNPAGARREMNLICKDAGNVESWNLEYCGDRREVKSQSLITPHRIYIEMNSVNNV